MNAVTSFAVPILMRSGFKAFCVVSLMWSSFTVCAQVKAPAQNLTTTQAPAQVIHLSVGQAHVINETNIKRIAVGNGKVLQATALDDRQILIIPEAPGQSTLHLWQRQGVDRVSAEKTYVVNVLPSDANRLLTEVRAMIGEDSAASARIVGDKVVLEGSNLTEQAATRLQEIAKRYPSVINLVSKIGVERMIAIDVRMIEIRRDVLQNIGVKWSGQAQGPSFGIVGDLHRSIPLRPNGNAQGVANAAVQPYVAPFSTAVSLVSNFTSMLNLMVQSGEAVILAEPRLSCRSGGEAKFIAGGELPMPVSAGLGQVSVVFKEYGVKFEIKPVATENGMISAKIATEISALNFDVMIKDIPGLTKRRAETDVNLRENETLVIAGLVTDDMSRNVEKVPAIGDIPVIGKLFRSKQFREQQTEMIVMITPRFVQGEAVPGAAESFSASQPPKNETNKDAVQAARKKLTDVRNTIQMLE
jgi:pilus assembly protein CpaC